MIVVRLFENSQPMAAVNSLYLEALDGETIL